MTTNYKKIKLKDKLHDDLMWRIHNAQIDLVVKLLNEINNIKRENSQLKKEIEKLKKGEF